MLLPADSAPNVEVVAFEDEVTFLAGEAVRMVLQLQVCHLNVETLEAAITAFAHRAVELVVVPAAVRMVVEHVKVGRLKRFFAGLADEAWPVIVAGQASIRRANRFTDDDLAAASAVALSTWSARTRLWSWRRVKIEPGVEAISQRQGVRCHGAL